MSTKINELDNIALKHDVADDDISLAAGTVGTVVHKYSGAKAYEVEFMNASGATVSVMTLKASDIKPLKKGEMFFAGKPSQF